MKNRAFVVATLLAVFEPSARADPTSAEDLYTEGQAAYDRKDFLVAIAKWQASYDLSKENDLLFNIAQAKRLSGDCAGAITTYHRFTAVDSQSWSLSLSVPTDKAAERHKLAEDLARELESRCNTLPVIDKPTEPTPAAQLHDYERPGRTLKIAGLVTGGAGIAAIATGLYVGHRAQTIGSEVTNACRVSCDWTAWKDKDAAGQHDAAVGRVLDVVGVLGIAGGAVMYYVGWRQGAVTVAPRTREGGAVVSWSGAW